MLARDKTELYYQLKEKAKEDKKQSDKRDFLAYIHERSSSSSSFPTINFIKRGSIDNSSNNNNNSGYSSNNSPTTSQYANNNSKPLNIPPPIPQPKIKLSERPDCLNCGKSFGIFTSKYPCSLCNMNFCNSCLKILSSKDITGVLKSNQVMSYCPICHLIVTKEENKRRFQLGCEKSNSEPILLLYNDITLVKRSIVGALPSFEYLSSSLTDFTKASKKNKDTFSQVYNQVLELQNDLAVLFKDFDKHVKAIGALPTTSSYQASIIKNMKSVYYSFLQQNLPKFKGIQNELLHIELNIIRNTYIYLARSGLDNQMQREFWGKYGKSYQMLMAIIRKDLKNCCVKCKVDYDKVKSLIDEMIVNEEKSSLNIQGHAKNEEEGTLMRKNIEFLKNILEEINIRAKPDELLESKKAISDFITEINNHYNSIVFNNSF